MMLILISIFFMLEINAATINSHVKTMEEFFPGTENNLTVITWAHAVNSQALLKNALNSSVMMLEADIVLGRLINGDDSIIPIMAHPPNVISDLSLQDFLQQVKKFNDGANSNVKKGIKLDFKSIEVFENSLNYMTELYPQINYPFWLNADILVGPVDATSEPVDARRFLTSSKLFPKAVLSLGWKTRYGDGDDTIRGSYTDPQINQMKLTIQQNGISQGITFPVRAGIAAESLTQMKELVAIGDNSTLTLWTGGEDPINIANLRSLILEIGVDRVYVDLPDDIKDQLHLNEPSVASSRTISLMLLYVCISFLLYRLL